MDDGRGLRAWVPEDLDASTAGAVFYVHGYYSTLDDAWAKHRLPMQFASSRQNAVFVAVSAPSSADEPVKWPCLADVEERITSLLGFLPTGPFVAAAHSGGFRTVSSWLERGAGLRQVTLLDGLYGHIRQFAEWVTDGASQRRSMNLVGCAKGAPRRNVTAFEASLSPLLRSEVVHRIGVPERFEEFTLRQRGARVLAVVASQTHMELVTGGAVLPIMLRRSPLQLIEKTEPTGGAIA